MAIAISENLRAAAKLTEEQQAAAWCEMQDKLAESHKKWDL